MAQSLAHGVDRLIVHQFDAAVPVPGGIDTCIRGILSNAPANVRIAVVGVVANGEKQRVGTWESHDFSGRKVDFLAVDVLDPADQKRLIPHSIRLVRGVIRHRSQIPVSRFVQCHRMDTATTVPRLLKSELIYFIHTQGSGLTGNVSDSFWRYAPGVHRRLEHDAVAAAAHTVVFNPDYANELAGASSGNVHFSPTWFDQRILPQKQETGSTNQILWAGRMERPKDPTLAIKAFSEIASDDFHLHMVGDGSEFDDVADQVKGLDDQIRRRITLHGRLPQPELYQLMSRSKVFLMTSQPGYEGYPRVLVEALACGLPAVVTEGCDTGSLVRADVNGFVVDRDPDDIAAAIARAATLDPSVCAASVAELSAERVVAQIFEYAEVEDDDSCRVQG